MKKLLIGLLLTNVLSISIAFATLSQNQVASSARNQQQALSFQIIANQLQFTKQSFKTVTLVKDANSNYEVQVELTPQAAQQLNELTSANINHQINIVWQQHIINTATIQTPLNGEFQISGFDKQQAEEFVNDMK